MAKCAKCGLPLAFKKLENGKLYPTNLDGSDHFDICREKQFGDARLYGIPFETETTKGIHHKNKTILTEITGKTITGKKYFSTGHNCIPWEKCDVCAPLIAARNW